MEEFKQFQLNLQNLFGPVAYELAFTSGFRQRASRLGGAELAEALIAGWWANPAASRATLARSVGVSKQALDQSLTQSAATFLQALLDWTISQWCASSACSVELLQRFGGVYLFDSSVVSLPAELAQLWPGCGSTKAAGASAAGLKMHVGLELGSGELIGPAFSPARTHDRSGPHQHLVLPAAALRITDLGYFKLKRFYEIAQNEQGFYLSKIQCGVQFYPNEDGPAVGLGEWLAEQAPQVSQIDRWVRMGAAQKLKCRLVALRVSEPIVAKRQAAFKEQARKRCRPVSAEQVRLSYWLVYLTNLPEALASAEEIGVLYRLRWQLELIFKLWKSEGGLDEWHSAKPWAMLCEFYAKLIGQIVQHWILVQTGWQSEGRSLVAASRVIRQHVRGLVLRLWQVAALLEGWELLKQDLAQSLALEGSGRRPSSYQLMQKPPPVKLILKEEPGSSALLADPLEKL